MARIADKNPDLCEDSAVGIAGIYLPDDLVIFVPELGKLSVKIVQPGDELGFRGIDFIDFQLSAEEP